MHGENKKGRSRIVQIRMIEVLLAKDCINDGKLHPFACTTIMRALGDIATADLYTLRECDSFSTVFVERI
jgi:hypothetical protein